MNKRPKVSIITITYNQEEYIGAALQSIVNQKGDLRLEVIVADDASTDRTPEIIKEFADKYPERIKPVLRKKNIGPWLNFVDAIQSSTGDYIALCEGDDFWTDPLKLQKQVDFMEKHPDYALCFHPVRVFFENGEEPESIYPESSNKTDFNLINLLKTNFIQTNSVIYRRQEYKKMKLDMMPGDWYLHLYHAQFGKIGFINEVMSVYRRHSGGVWWQSTQRGDIDEFWEKYGITHINMYIELLKIYGNSKHNRDIIDNNIASTVSTLNRIEFKNKKKLMQAYMDEPIERKNILLLSLSRVVYTSRWTIEKINYDIKIKKHSFQNEKEQLQNEKEQLQNEKEQLQNEKEQLQNEKEQLLNAKVYKIGNFIVGPYRSIRRVLNRLDK